MQWSAHRFEISLKSNASWINSKVKVTKWSNQIWVVILFTALAPVWFCVLVSQLSSLLCFCGLYHRTYTLVHTSAQKMAGTETQGQQGIFDSMKQKRTRWLTSISSNVHNSKTTTAPKHNTEGCKWFLDVWVQQHTAKLVMRTGELMYQKTSLRQKKISG